MDELNLVSQLIISSPLAGFAVWVWLKERKENQEWKQFFREDAAKNLEVMGRLSDIIDRMKEDGKQQNNGLLDTLNKTHDSLKEHLKSIEGKLDKLNDR